MTTSLEWMMDAITRAKMNDPKEPRPRFPSAQRRPHSPDWGDRSPGPENISVNL